MFKKLPSNSICSGILRDASCKNVGQKCRCQTDKHASGSNSNPCVCVNVDPLGGPYEHNCNSSVCSSRSSSSCICAYKEFRIQIKDAPKNCAALTNRHSHSHASKFNSCPYRLGTDCSCERNPNTGTKQCFCRTANPFKQIPPFNRRPQPYTHCNKNRDCMEHNDIHCYCTNRVNATKIEHISSSAVANLPNLRYYTVETLCYPFGQPPALSCYPFGYTARCRMGFCQLESVNLYFNNRDDNVVDNVWEEEEDD